MKKQWMNGVVVACGVMLMANGAWAGKAEIQKRAETAVIDTISFTQVAIEEALDTISAKTGIVIKKVDIPKDTPPVTFAAKNIPALEALNIVTELANLTYAITDKGIDVSGKRAEAGKKAEAGAEVASKRPEIQRASQAAEEAMRESARQGVEPRASPAASLTPRARVEVGHFTCATNRGGITITRYTGPGGNVKIPGRINGLPINSIGDMAFSECASLNSVTIPIGVTAIGYRAFNSCANLTTLALPTSVTRISSNAFECCYALSNVTIPAGVTSIGDAAFSYCIGLTNFTISATVAYIGSNAFFDCRKLAAIVVDSGNRSFSSKDGVLFNKSKTTLIKYPQAKSGSYTIPGSVSVIGDGAFMGVISPTITIPSSVTRIESGAFAGAELLTSVTIPNSVTDIGMQAFCQCASLAKVVIGNRVERMGAMAFDNCDLLTRIAIPASVIKMETSITIPGQAEPLDQPLFACARLESIEVNDQNAAYSSVNGILFNKGPSGNSV
jgi:hypothetical protein